MESEEGPWRRLEPASLVVNLVPTLWRTLKSLWYVFVPLLVGGSLQGAVDLGFLVLFFGVAVLQTVLHYATLRYRMSGGKLEILTGLVGRRHRVIDPARIQNLEIVQNLFHRAAGLVELRVETAGDSGAEGMLSAISVREAESLRTELEAARRGGVPLAAGAADAPPEEVGRIGVAELIGYGVSAGRAGAGVLMFWLFAQVMGDYQAPMTLPGQPAGTPDVTELLGVNRHDPGSLAGVFLLGFAGAYAFSVGNAVLRFFNFRLVRGPRGIATESGLFTRRRVEIPPRKVQVLRLDEPVMRRLMGYGSLQIETAASGVPDEQGSSDAVIPMVARDEAARTMGLVLPGLPADLLDRPLEPAAPRALLRALTGATVRWGLLAAGLWWLGAGAWPLLLLGWGWVASALDWRAQGWRLDGDWIVTRRGFPARRTWIVPLDKLQSVHRVQGPMMRRHRLARLTLWVAGTRVSLPDLREGDVEALFDRLCARWTGGRLRP